MPGARTHDAITLITVTAADIGYAAYAPHPDLTLAALFTVAYVFAGFACAGDLDLNSREYRRWGPLRCIWWPYRVLVPHRSWISHGLILGGLIRALYLGLAFTLVTWVGTWAYSRLGPHVDPNQVTGEGWRTLSTLAGRHPQDTIALLAGFVLAGTAHSIADLISTWCKRRC
jgi:uncharacterized metal-binding protein